MIAQWPIVERRDMKPGTMFEVISEWPVPELRVVLDDKTETDFWRGGMSSIGTVAPGWTYRVVAFPVRR